MMWHFSPEEPETRQQREFPTLWALILALHPAVSEGGYLRQTTDPRQAGLTEHAPKA